jgi:sugar phosphate isomerase/epimerase
MRKSFILILSFLLFAPQLLFAQQSKLVYTAPIGVQAYTFRRSFPVSISKTLDTIKMMGITEMETTAHGLPPEEFRKMCNERGITIPSTEADYQQLLTSADSVAHVAKVLGAHYVMCAWIPHNGAFTLKDAQKAATDFNKIGKELSDSGLIFCYHAHGYEFQPYKNGTLLDYLIQHTNPKYVSFEMDIFWISFGGGDPVGLMKKYGDRWKLMHLKDMKKGTVKNLSGGTDPNNDVVLGTGELDMPAILKEAKKIGIKHYFIEDESDHVDEQVPKSIAYLKSLKD